MKDRPIPEPTPPLTGPAFRQAMSRFATGITVVTAPGPDGPMGFTANSFSSVSLHPPLVQWSIALSSRRYEVFAAAPFFAIHVLSAQQLPLAMNFSQRGDGFEAFEWFGDANGVPILPDTLARFDCKHYTRHPAGDHSIILGEVTGVATRAGECLVFSQGQYGHFSA